MKYTVIRYTVTKSSDAENRRLVEAVFAELRQSRPSGLSYTVLELETGEFVHIAGSEEGRSMTELAAFADFTTNHADRRQGDVVRAPAQIVGRYEPDHR